MTPIGRLIGRVAGAPREGSRGPCASNDRVRLAHTTPPERSRYAFANGRSDFNFQDRSTAGGVARCDSGVTRLIRLHRTSPISATSSGSKERQASSGSQILQAQLGIAAREEGYIRVLSAGREKLLAAGRLDRRAPAAIVLSSRGY
jgi:hypothetical protein